MKLSLILCAAAILVAAPASARSAHSGIQFVDLTDDFARIYDRDAALPEAERLARFKAEFATLISDFYSAKRTAKGDESKYDERLRKALAAYPAERADIARVSSKFGALIAKAQVSFERQFGPFPADQPVYLVNSFGEMDGGTRDLGGNNVLVFGADVIAKVHSGNTLTPFFHHELFHVYHSRQIDRRACEQIWCAMWGEGLAVYVAKRLNPKASDAELLLTVPEPIRPAVEAHKTEAVCAALARLDSSSDDDYRAMFNFKRLSPTLPPRFAYYIGYLVAEDLGRSRSLKALAKMQGPALRKLVGDSLSNMATCPAPTA